MSLKEAYPVKRMKSCLTVKLSLCHVHGLHFSKPHKIKSESPDRAGLRLSGRIRAAGSVFSCLSVGLWSSEGTYTVHGQDCWRCSPEPSFYWPGSSSTSCMSMLHRNTFFCGTAHPSNFPTPTSCTMKLTERGSQTFPYEDPHPNTHLSGFYQWDPPWSIDMCCYDLDVVN